MSQSLHILLPLAFAGVGALAACLQLRWLSLDVRALLKGSPTPLLYVGPPLRAAVVALLFLPAANYGATTLAASLAGFLAFRAALLRRPRTLLP